MSPDLIFWLALAVKMAVTGAFVVVVAWIAERVGGVIGGLVASLPISSGPAYVFLSLDHDAAFIAQSALTSVAVNVGSFVFALSYIVLAQRRGTAISLTGALALWFATTAAVQRLDWNLAGATAVNIVGIVVSLPIARRFQSARLPRAVAQWYDVPLRAGLVSALVAIVVIASRQLGPAAAGTLAVFPVVFSSLVMIIQPRIGGPATAALFANTLSGLIGFTVALIVLHLTAEPLGSPLALSLALATSISWNLMLWFVWYKRRS
jgi:hypothetical protein